MKKPHNQTITRLFVVPLGLEPRLFWTKTKRVASYTMGQFALFKCGGKFKYFFLFSKKNNEKVTKKDAARMI